MIKRIYVILFVAFLTLLTTEIASAENVLPKDVVRISEIIQNLQSKGYYDINEIEFDDGIYKAEAINQENKEVKLYIDPHKNEITMIKTGEERKVKTTLPHLSMLDVIKKIEAAGYHDIYQIDFERNKYQVKALDKNDMKVELKVDADTGNISTK